MMWVVWNLVLVRLEMVLASVQDRCTDSTNCTIGSKLFWMQPMVLLGEEAQVEAHLWRLEIVLILTRDGCTVGAERTIGLEIILDALDRNPRRHESCRISLRSIWGWS